MASTAIAAAIAALAVCWSVVGGIAFAAVAILLAAAARRNIRRGTADNDPVAVAGLALAVLAIVMSLAVIPIWARLYTDVDVPKYVACVGAATDPPRIEQCGVELRQRIDEKLGLPAQRAT